MDRCANQNSLQRVRVAWCVQHPKPKPPVSCTGQHSHIELPHLPTSDMSLSAPDGAFLDISGDFPDKNHQRTFERILLKPIIQLSNEVAVFVLRCGLTILSFLEGVSPDSMKRHVLTPFAGYVTIFVNLNRQTLDAFASKNHGAELLLCPYRYFGLSRDRYPEYFVATDGVSLRFPFSCKVKPTRKRRTKIEMKEARAAGEVESSTPLKSNVPRQYSKKSPGPKDQRCLQVSNKGIPNPNHRNLVGWTAGQSCGPLRHDLITQASLHDNSSSVEPTDSKLLFRSGLYSASDCNGSRVGRCYSTY
ncbi:hypothetical protein P9112_007824 [Eukaryota sp. TZLM1-RC]